MVEICLVYVHYRGFHIVCLAGGGCEQVQASRYAEVARVPVAVLRLFGYAGILATMTARGESARLTAVALIGVGFSDYLT